MLTIVVLGEEHWDEDAERFVFPESFELQLEHSLVALSKWEQEFEKPFLGPDQKSDEELIGYVHCMCLDPTVPRERLYQLSQENYDEIDRYLNRKMTATWFTEHGPQSRKSGETITAELVYFWMSTFNIPIEWETRNITNLFTYIRIANEKNSPPKKMSRSEAAQQQRELNRRRRAEMGTNG